MAAVSETRRTGGMGCVFWLVVIVVGAVMLLGTIEVPGVGDLEALTPEDVADKWVAEEWTEARKAKAQELARAGAKLLLERGESDLSLEDLEDELWCFLRSREPTAVDTVTPEGMADQWLGGPSNAGDGRMMDRDPRGDLYDSSYLLPQSEDVEGDWDPDAVRRDEYGFEHDPGDIPDECFE